MSPDMTAAKRPWFRVSLRTALLVVALIGCWLGWHLRWIQQRRLADEWIAENPPQSMHDITYVQKSLPWSLRILGEQQRAQIVVSTHDPVRLERIRALFPESEVRNVGFLQSHVEFPEATGPYSAPRGQ